MTNKKKKLTINHGKTHHLYSDWQNCPFCIDIHIEYCQAIEKAGGITKFISKLANK